MQRGVELSVKYLTQPIGFAPGPDHADVEVDRAYWVEDAELSWCGGNAAEACVVANDRAARAVSDPTQQGHPFTV